LDLSCIISSGDLELYVLGMLPADEAEKITRLAELFPEIDTEINRITAALKETAEMQDSAPSPALRNKVMLALSDLNKEESGKKDAPVVEMIPPAKKGRSWMAAASVVALLATIGFMYMYKTQMNQREEITKMQASLDQLRGNLQQQQARISEDSLMMAMYNNEGILKIKLKALPGGADADVQLFWNKETRDVYVAQMRLPQTPSGKQYQLWAIVDGKPVDAGVLSSGMAMQKMKAFPRAEAFAITLEKAGGSPTPTLETMIVMANT
jgi:anti-sigma-K factor RskA